MPRGRPDFQFGLSHRLFLNSAQVSFLFSGLLF